MHHVFQGLQPRPVISSCLVELSFHSISEAFLTWPTILEAEVDGGPFAGTTVLVEAWYPFEPIAPLPDAVPPPNVVALPAVDGPADEGVASNMEEVGVASTTQKCSSVVRVSKD